MAPHENAQIAEHCERFKCELPQPHLHWQILLLHYDKERSQRPKEQEVLMSMEVKHPHNRNRKPTGKTRGFQEEEENTQREVSLRRRENTHVQKKEGNQTTTTVANKQT
jgi:hypothetical protein